MYMWLLSVTHILKACQVGSNVCYRVIHDNLSRVSQEIYSTLLRLTTDTMLSHDTNKMKYKKVLKLKPITVLKKRDI